MMPKHLRSSSSHNRYGDTMPVSLAASTGGTGTPLYTTRMTMPTTTTYYSPMQASSSAAAAAAAAAASMTPQQSYDQYAVGAVPVPPVPQRASSGAWSPQDDQTLLTARAQGLNWSQIQQSYFQTKSANACRKRHERLMERKGADDWDARKFEQIAKEYMSMRKEIWSGLAARTGEKWNVVEAKCMSHGLKNLQSAARAGARRERLESGHPLPAGYDDDSGISGVGLTPVDDLDHSYRDTSYHSSPGGSSGVGSHHSGSSAASVSGGGYTNATMHSLQPFGSSHGYTYSSGPHHGYTSSVSSTGTTAGAYGGPVSQPSGSPYLDHHSQRLSSVDMGIDAIINRPGGAMH